MSQNYYELYLNSVLELAETLVVKFEYAATQVNQNLLTQYGVSDYDPLDKRTWKYYMHIAGMYHSTDSPMTITSLDTLQEIAFTKENLALHPATKAAYIYNSRYYLDLVSRYPLQDDLILGILYPCDLDTAINADDFTVLSYPPHLIEPTEVSLVSKINDWLKKFKHRWFVSGFTITDNQYATAFLGVTALNLVPLILNLRDAAEMTNEAHSFHIRQYLASHSRLDRYMDQMTTKQALFFYRNIRYIQRNIGQADTFEWLTEKVLTDRGIPLSSYTMVQDTANMPEVLTPDVTFKKTLLNPETVALDKAANYATLPDLLAKELPLATGNSDYAATNQDDIHTSFQNSPSSTVATKVLESAMVDYTDAIPVTLQRVLLNQWIYLTRKDLYKAYSQVKNPKTGTTFTIDAQSSYLLFIYAYLRTLGVTLLTVPQVLAQKVPAEPKPSLDYIYSVVDPTYVDISTAQQALDLIPTRPAIGSRKAFQDYCLALHSAQLKLYNLGAGQEDANARGMVMSMTSRLFVDTLMSPLLPNTFYLEWFPTINFDPTGFEINDWEVLYRNLYQGATGYSLTETDALSTLQQAMVGVMQQLSSYSVQYVTDINSLPITMTNWGTIRPTNLRRTSTTQEQAPIINLQADTVAHTSTDEQRIDINPPGVKHSFDMGIRVFGPKLDLTVGFNKPPQISYPSAKIDLGTIHIGKSALPYEVGDLSELPLYASFYALSQEEQNSYKTIYGTCMPALDYPTKIDMNNLLLNTNLPGMSYLSLRDQYLNVFNYFYVPPKTLYFLNTNTEVELECFFPNNEPQIVESFKINAEAQKVNVFKYVTDIPLDNIVLSEVFTGGWTMLSVFDPTVKVDTEFFPDKAFYDIHDTRVLTVYPTVKTMELAYFQNVYNVSKTINLSKIRDVRSVTLTKVQDTRQIDLFKNSAARFEFGLTNTTTRTQGWNLFSVSDQRSIFTYGVSDTHEASGFGQGGGVSILTLLNTLVKVNMTDMRVVRASASLTDMFDKRATASLSVFNNAFTVRGLPQFTVYNARRSLDLFNFLLGQGARDITVLGTASAREIQPVTVFSASTLNALNNWRIIRDLAAVISVTDSRSLDNYPF